MEEDEGVKGLDKIQAGSVTKGNHIMIGDKPCKVISTTKAKPGKHGSAKAIIVAVGIIDDKKVEKTFGTSDMIDVPSMKRTEYLLLGVDEDYLQLQSENGEMKDDVKFSDQATMQEVNEQIKKFWDDEIDCLVTVLNVNGLEIPCAVREEKKD